MLLCLPQIAFAHPGHDHSSPFAVLVHFAWLAPLVAVGILVARYMKSKKNKSNHSE